MILQGRSTDLVSIATLIVLGILGAQVRFRSCAIIDHNLGGSYLQEKSGSGVCQGHDMAFLCSGKVFKILHTNFIFRKIILRTGTVVSRIATEIGSVGI